MTGNCRFAYAQARVQARFSRLPAEAEWQRLAAARTLAVFLEEARAGGLRDWIKGFSNQSDSHDLEAGVRNLFRETVAEVAGWVPTPWRESLLWVGWLPLLPLLGHLARGGGLPPWVVRDPFLRPLRVEGGGLDPGRLGRAGAGPLAPLPPDPVGVWEAEWARRRPACGRTPARHLDELVRLLREHTVAFRAAPPETAWELRKGLRALAARLFHRRLLQPVGPFLFLLLTALDLERLRAELVTRAVFASGEAAA